MSQLSVVSASRKKPVKEEDDEDYQSPPAKIKRDAFGYVASGKIGPKVGCKSCYYFDNPNSECELFEMVQEELPSLFALDKSVADNAGCEAHILK
jgi:hypothetical protein